MLSLLTSRRSWITSSTTHPSRTLFATSTEAVRSGSYLITRRRNAASTALDHCPWPLAVPNQPLFGERRKYRQLFDVAGIVLDNEGRLQVRCNLLDALDRSHRLGAVIVERGYAVRIVVFVEMHRVARQDDSTHLRQLDQQAG